MIDWLMKRWLKKAKFKGLDQKTMDEVQKSFALSPTKDYLIGLMDEVVRQGIYMSPERQEGAKFLLETLRKEIEKGQIIIKKEQKLKDKQTR